MIRQDDKPNSFEREWAGIALAAADAVSPQPEYEQRLRELFIEVMEQTHDDAMAAAETASDDWREGAEWFGATLAMYWGQKMRSEDV